MDGRILLRRWMAQDVTTSKSSRREDSREWGPNGGMIVLFKGPLEDVWQFDGNKMARGWVEDGSKMERRWADDRGMADIGE